MGRNDDRLKIIASFCNLAPNLVLDVGCGVGEPLKQYIKGEYVSFDISKDGMVQGTAYYFPFNDSLFDVVVLGEVLEHLTNPYSALCEARRVCKDTIIISVPNPHSYKQLISIIKNGYNLIEPAHIGLFGYNEIENICRSLKLSQPRSLLSRFSEYSIYLIRV